MTGVMAVKHGDARDPLEIEIDGDLRTLHQRGLYKPDVHDLEALLRVARALSQTGTNLEKIEVALALAISDYGDGSKIETVHLWFGLHPETQDTRQMTSSKRHVAAWEYAKEKGAEEKPLSSFRTHGSKRRYRFLARRLFVRYTEETATHSEPARPPERSREVSPADPRDPTAEPTHSDGNLSAAPSPSRTRQHRWLAKHWWLPASLASMIALAVSLMLTGTWNVAPTNTPLPNLSRLAAESERHLTGSTAPGPEKRMTAKLGFGDPTPNGRLTYYETEHGFIPSSTPTFNALVNANYHVGDERRFLRVETSLVTNAQQLWQIPDKHAVQARPNEVVWVLVYVDNNAAKTPHCALTGPYVATDTRLRVAIWNSTDDHLHIIRAWLTAKNTHPAWITDAVAVLTPNITTLEPDSSISREYSKLSPQFHTNPTINVESLLLYPGMLISGNGIVGSCWDNRYYLALGFRQH